MIYVSTRGRAQPADASAAILNGLAEDGGLYVPGELPEPDVELLVVLES